MYKHIDFQMVLQFVNIPSNRCGALDTLYFSLPFVSPTVGNRPPVAMHLLNTHDSNLSCLLFVLWHLADRSSGQSAKLPERTKVRIDPMVIHWRLIGWEHFITQMEKPVCPVSLGNKIDFFNLNSWNPNQSSQGNWLNCVQIILKRSKSIERDRKDINNDWKSQNILTFLI